MAFIGRITRNISKSTRSKGVVSGKRTSMRRCARSSWPCSRPMSTSGRKKQFVATTKEKVQMYSKSLTPGAASTQDREGELVDMMGGANSKLTRQVDLLFI